MFVIPVRNRHNITDIDISFSNFRYLKIVMDRMKILKKLCDGKRKSSCKIIDLREMTMLDITKVKSNHRRKKMKILATSELQNNVFKKWKEIKIKRE